MKKKYKVLQKIYKHVGLKEASTPELQKLLGKDVRYIHDLQKKEFFFSHDGFLHAYVLLRKRYGHPRNYYRISEMGLYTLYAMNVKIKSDHLRYLAKIFLTTDNIFIQNLR